MKKLLPGVALVLAFQKYSVGESGSKLMLFFFTITMVSMAITKL